MGKHRGAHAIRSQDLASNVSNLILCGRWTISKASSDGNWDSGLSTPAAPGTVPI